MIRVDQIGARKFDRSKQCVMMRVEWNSGPWGGGGGLGKRSGMMENGVVMTTEETREDYDNGGGRDAG